MDNALNWITKPVLGEVITVGALVALIIAAAAVSALWGRKERTAHAAVAVTAFIGALILLGTIQHMDAKPAPASLLGQQSACVKAVLTSGGERASPRTVSDLRRARTHCEGVKPPSDGEKRIKAEQDAALGASELQ